MSSIVYSYPHFGRVDLSCAGGLSETNFHIRNISRYTILGKLFKYFGFASELYVHRHGMKKKYYVNTKSFFKKIKKQARNLNCPLEPLKKKEYKTITEEKIIALFSKKKAITPVKAETPPSFNKEPRTPSPSTNGCQVTTPLKRAESPVELRPMPSSRAIAQNHPFAFPLPKMNKTLEAKQAPEIILPNGNTYKGAVDSNNRPHGIGSEFKFGKLCYQGRFENAERSGFGQEYEVSCISQTPLYYISSLVYKGNFLKGLKEGYGEEFQGSSCIFRGSFHEGLRSGSGTLFRASGLGSVEYAGGFQKGLFDGDGKYYGSDGSIYDGHFFEGKRSGEGSFFQMRYNRESGKKSLSLIYKGGFLDGQYHGQGLFYEENGDAYQGGFELGQKKGRGVYRFRIGIRNECEGEFEGKIFKGRCLYKDSSVYEGEMIDFEKSGKGIFTSCDQKSVKNGVWNKDQFIEGVEDYQDSSRGIRQKTHFKNGLIDGEQFFSKNEICRLTTFREGKKRGPEYFYSNGAITSKIVYVDDKKIREFRLGSFNSEKRLHGPGVYIDHLKKKSYYGLFENGKLDRPIATFETVDFMEVLAGIKKLRSNIANHSENASKTAKSTAAEMKKIYYDFMKNKKGEKTKSHQLEDALFDKVNDLDALKKVYRDLARATHPDRNADAEGDKALAEGCFKEMSAVYTAFVNKQQSTTI